MKNNNIQIQTFDSFGYIGWKYYKTIKKKAMDEEFSFSGLLLSFSIAFFIVLGCAQGLSIFYKVYTNDNNGNLKREKNHQYEVKGKRIELSTDLLALIDLVKQSFTINAANAGQESYLGSADKTTNYLTLKNGKEVTYTLNIKNTGKTTWKKGQVFFETGPALKSFSKIKHNSWLSFYRVAGIEKDVPSGQAAKINFTLKAPNEVLGTIQENFQLVKDGETPIKGTLTRFFIEVTDKEEVQTAKITTPAVKTTLNKAVNNMNVNNKPTTPVATAPKTNIITTPYSSSASNNVVANNQDALPKFCIALSDDERSKFSQCNTNLNEGKIDQTNGIAKTDNIYQTEPIIRVGLFTSTAIQRVSCSDIYDVYAGKDQLVFSGLAANTSISISFDFNKKAYLVTLSGMTNSATQPIRIVPRAGSQGIVSLLDYIHRPGWNSSLNDNSFRNVIEFNYSTATGKLWVINELPMTYYLKGMAETSNISPLEFQKALMAAAHTYAMYHYNRGIEYKVPDGSTKHANEHFHVDATYDQVYRGYASEQRMPKLSQAVDETRGYVVTYNKAIAITPYYSRSDGRTRSWEEVWGGEAKPWLKSVSVPEDQGQELWGHGVGMSARGALVMAADENKKWDEILKYFYQGTELQKIY